MPALGSVTSCQEWHAGSRGTRMAGTHQLRRFKGIINHGSPVLRLLRIASLTILRGLARLTDAMTDATLDAGLLRASPQEAACNSPRHPGHDGAAAAMSDLITINGHGTRTSRVLHASDGVTQHRIVICWLWHYFLKSITGR